MSKTAEKIFLKPAKRILDYDKNGGQSSNVDSGRGSVAYSSGRRPEASLHDTSADSDAVASRVQPQPGPSQQVAGPSKKLSNLLLEPLNSSHLNKTDCLPGSSLVASFPCKFFAAQALESQSAGATSRGF